MATDLIRFGEGTTVRVDAAATKLPGGAVEMALTTSIVYQNEVIDVPRRSTIKLINAVQKKLPVMDAPSLSGDVLSLVSVHFSK